jgi:hypothetical protein
MLAMTAIKDGERYVWSRGEQAVVPRMHQQTMIVPRVHRKWFRMCTRSGTNGALYMVPAVHAAKGPTKTNRRINRPETVIPRSGNKNKERDLRTTRVELARRGRAF